MSETEKYEQVGRLAEEYSQTKGKFNHINERLLRAFSAYQAVVQISNQNAAALPINLKVVAQNFRGAQPDVLNHLLSSHEMVEVLEERSRVERELLELTGRIKALAPHLLP